MKILITGGSGFVGARLARALLAQGQLSVAGAPARKVESITLADRAPPPDDLAKDPRITFVGGDLNEQLASKQVPAAGTEVVFHLAAAVSGECEADFDLGMRSNFAATHALLEACRALGNRPTVVFSSSVAVFGKLPGGEMPDPIEDFTLPTPQSSYGNQKAIGELMMADYARKGYIRARSVRLMTVSVRPGRPNGAASSFFSGMIREPLAGVRAQVPVGAEVQHPILSPSLTIEGLIRCAEASDAEWGPLTGLNLPSLCVSVGEMAAALERVSPEAARLLDWVPDERIGKLVYGWPGKVHWPRAKALGLKANTDFESIVREYIRENPQAVKVAVR
ncbi:D-erythronate dehydrogenase [Ramlibacter sp. PS4R-6]|uniref:D-erythronate dehydrogenase n=1 Tax=Ramlibacter sp. PS4R-6 TaxID=3133438 RepID=UPI00309A637B